MIIMHAGKEAGVKHRTGDRTFHRLGRNRVAYIGIVFASPIFSRCTRIYKPTQCTQRTEQSNSLSSVKCCRICCRLTISSAAKQTQAYPIAHILLPHWLIWAILTVSRLLFIHCWIGVRPFINPRKIPTRYKPYGSFDPGVPLQCLRIPCYNCSRRHYSVFSCACLRRGTLRHGGVVRAVY